MDKEWKEIPEYEGIYEVSNYGDVRSLGRQIIQSNGALHYLNPKILKKQSSGNGYYQVSLWKDNVRKIFRIHRLVALCFCENKYKYNVVNHKDGDKKNNYYKNLEWCTYSENNKHSYSVLKNTSHMKGKFNGDHPLAIKVYQIDSKQKIVKEWSCGKEIYRTLGISQSSIIRSCRSGNMHKGYFWTKDIEQWKKSQSV